MVGMSTRERLNNTLEVLGQTTDKAQREDLLMLAQVYSGILIAEALSDIATNIRIYVR